jgi:NitT/TauT family transport system ATP-binding protein
MRQRAALARAFIAQPQTLLMDEPFGALDALTRLSLQDVLRQLVQQEKPSVVLVTHDVDEALFLADRVVVFSPRPARVLREFNLAHRTKTHDLSSLAGEKREILRLLGIEVDGHAEGATALAA